MASKKKLDLVHKLAAEVRDYPIVGVVNMQNLPATQLQRMKIKLAKNGISIIMTRKRLIQRALTESKKANIDDLSAKVKGMPALIFTRGNPFTLYSLIQKNKSKAPAKAGQIAPRDLMVAAGPTNFAPGPIISELAAVGIKTKVENGKLAVIQDTVIVKEGQAISQKVSETLKRLDIQPMEIGLDLVAVWENGIVFDAKQLHIDDAEFVQNIAQAATWAINLAIEAAYPTTDTAEMLVQKAFRDAKAVGVEGAIMTEETRDDILAKSEAQAESVKNEAHLE
ncbi:50S ribosomal protein L10 [Candidatus Woesearchaeota archaeon]|nr:50S ribosomal protein L10 [Candidatus Woesearchaeota archaeon]